MEKGDEGKRCNMKEERKLLKMGRGNGLNRGKRETTKQILSGNDTMKLNSMHANRNKC